MQVFENIHRSHQASENETEVSLFNRELYEKFKTNPTVPILFFFVSAASDEGLTVDKLGLKAVDIITMGVPVANVTIQD